MVLANPYSYAINHLNFALRKRNFYFNIRLSKKVLIFLGILKKLNLIRRFYKFNHNQITVFPTYTYLIPTYRLKNFYRLGNPIILRRKALSLITKSIGNSILILETSKGLLTQTQAIQRRCGGILVCSIL